MSPLCFVLFCFVCLTRKEICILNLMLHTPCTFHYKETRKSISHDTGVFKLCHSCVKAIRGEAVRSLFWAMCMDSMEAGHGDPFVYPSRRSGDAFLQQDKEESRANVSREGVCLVPACIRCI